MAPVHGEQGPCSQVYVLRLWRETAHAPWRAALCPAGGGARIGFADLEELALFLLRLVDECASPRGAPVDADTWVDLM